MGAAFTKNKLSPEVKSTIRHDLEVYEDYDLPAPCKYIDHDEDLEAIASDYLKRENLRSAGGVPLSNRGHSSGSTGNSTSRSNYGVDLNSDEHAVDLPFSSRNSGEKLDVSQENIPVGSIEPDSDDGYYNMVEKAMYEKPKPVADTTEVNFPWQKGCLIGTGGFGRVFLGMNEETGEMIAVKEVLLIGDPHQQQKELVNFNREVAVMKNLQHENIVTYKGTRIIDDHFNIFMEYVPGGSIASLLGKFGRFSEMVIRKYTRQILLGLEYLHSHHIMHRDIKGANILVNHQGVIKLADFGASRRLEGLITANGGYRSLKGTPYWMAPEVVRQCGHGRQADIWSVGCTVIEMATGKPPWHEFPDPVSVLFHIASSDALPTMPLHLSPEAHDFLRLCFQRNPLERPNASRLLEHPFVSVGKRPSSVSPSPKSPRAPCSPIPPEFALPGTELQQVDRIGRPDTLSSPGSTGDFNDGNGVEEPTWTWDGDKRNMSFVDNKVKTIRAQPDPVTADRLQFDKRHKRSSTVDAQIPTPVSHLARRHSTFEQSSVQDFHNVLTWKTSAPAMTTGDPTRALTTVLSVGSVPLMLPTESPGTPFSLRTSSSSVSSDCNSMDSVVSVTKDFSSDRRDDVDEDTIRNFLLRQSMDLLHSKDFKFGMPQNPKSPRREKERAKLTSPKNFFEQLGDLFYDGSKGSSNTRKSSSQRSPPPNNHNHNKNSVRAAW